MRIHPVTVPHFLFDLQHEEALRSPGGAYDLAGAGVDGGRRGLRVVPAALRLPPPAFRLHEPVAVTVHFENVLVMREAIQQSASSHCRSCCRTSDAPQNPGKSQP